MAEKIYFGKEGRDILLKGAEQLSKTVKSTLGPRGRTVVIGNRYGTTPHATKDGVTVADSIHLPSVEEDMGAVMVRDAAKRTAETAGDGTTTATVLAEALMRLGADAINEGANPVLVKKGIDEAVAEVVSFIKYKAKKVDSSHADIKRIATISANNDETIGKLIADAMKIAGNDGEINVEEGKTYETTIEKVPGMSVERGFISPHFINQENGLECVLENPVIVMVDKKVSFARDIVPITQKAISLQRSILFIVDDLADEALTFTTINAKRKAVKVCAIKCPEIGARRKDVMDDIATVCGGVFMTEDQCAALDKIDPQKLLEEKCGAAEKVIITKNKTIIIGGGGKKEAVSALEEMLKKQLEVAEEHNKAFTKTRLAKVKNGVAILKIGGITEFEIKERADRIDDALCATRSAVEEGVIVGGGSAYVKSIEKIAMLTSNNVDIKKGHEIVKKALQEPMAQMIRNGGQSESEITLAYESILAGEYGVGYNGREEKIDNLLKAGVLDPAKVSRVALENAASIAGTFLMTEAVVVPIM